MPIGKYRHLAVEARQSANAVGAVVIVFEGDDGDGFAVDVARDAEDDLTPKILTTFLRTIADAIERGTQEIH